MTEVLAPSARPLIAEHGTTFSVDAFIVDVVWLGNCLALACGDGSLRFIDGPRPGDGPVVTVNVHHGAILCAAAHPDGLSMLTGGDDGRLVRSWPSGLSHELARFDGRWVEHVAANALTGVIACAAGKEACLLAKDARGAAGVSNVFSHPSTVGGIALDHKGRRLAVSHYGGVTLWWALAPEAERKQLLWQGSHLAVTWSPDSRFVITAMQENALHGWRVADAASMHMRGYPTKTRSLAWSSKGRWLATSGADDVVCWPFTGKNGPMDKKPLELGPRGLLVTRVACHPSEDAIAAGYENGSVILLRLADDTAAVVQVAGGGAVTALAWHGKGRALAIGSEDGRVGILAVAAGSE
jgi:WD40 repeat protein